MVTNDGTKVKGTAELAQAVLNAEAEVRRRIVLYDAAKEALKAAQNQRQEAEDALTKALPYASRENLLLRCLVEIKRLRDTYGVVGAEAEARAQATQDQWDERHADGGRP